MDTEEIFKEKSELNNTDTLADDHVVRIEIYPNNRVFITGSAQFPENRYPRSDQKELRRNHLWYSNEVRHTAIQEISKGKGGLKFKRYIPYESNTFNAYSIDEKSFNDVYSKRSNSNCSETEVCSKMDNQKRGDEKNKIISDTKYAKEGKINPGFTDEEIIRSVKEYDESNNNFNHENLQILGKIILDTNSSSKSNSFPRIMHVQQNTQSERCNQISPKGIDRQCDLEVNVLKDKPLQKSRSFSGVPKNPPTAQVLPNIHHNNNKMSTENQNITQSENDTDSSIANRENDVNNSSNDAKCGVEQQNKTEDTILEQVVTEKSNETQSDQDAKWLDWIEIQFKKIAGDDGEISLDEFKEALGVKKSFFAERFFSLFDKDGSGSIELKELMDGLQLLTKGTASDKLKFLFDVYDIDGSGTIDREELNLVLRSCMEESSLSFGEENLDELTDVLFESADEDNSGSISFDELKAELEKYPGVLENLTISAAQWLKPPAKSKKKEGISRYFTLAYIQNNLRKVLFLAWYILMNIGLGIYAGINYRNSNGFIIVARIGGMNLNFNCMFVCVLMLRKCLTKLRETVIAQVLPLDQSILFHKMVGLTIAFWAMVHTFAHIGNANYDSPDMELWEIFFTTKAGYGWVGGSAVVTGWALDIILIIMVICSMPFVRRGGHFQVFYITHMLYIPFWILCIIHGSNFWKWFIAPGVIFLGEKIFRSKLMKLARYGKTYIEEVNLLPSGVCHLVISRPEKFIFQAGDYIFLQIPALAKQEWHPFTISSAPEMKGTIWLHVRSAGHWTNKLYEYFTHYDMAIEEVKRRHKKPEKYRKIDDSQNKTEAEEQTFSRDISKYILNEAKKAVEKRFRRSDTMRRVKEKSKKVKVQCYIDGPYGTATREIFDTEHAVLVGAGIGITPMASILQSIMYRYKNSKRTCPKCANVWYGEIPEALMKLKKVDFIWINRDQKCFEWFVTLLTQLEMDQAEMDSDGGDDNHVIDMHMYMTAAQKKNDMKGLGLQIALDLMYKKGNKDLITGLKTKTEPGRPDWNKVFKKISEQKKGRVKVFFCGSPALGKIIKEYCGKFNFAFSKENF